MPNPHSSRGGMLAIAAATAAAAMAGGPIVIGYDEAADLPMRRIGPKRPALKQPKPARGRVRTSRHEARDKAQAGRKANVRRQQRERR